MSNNTSLQDVFAKAHKYREPKSINWKHNLKILMDYARKWAKRVGSIKIDVERVFIDPLSF
jgi:hypothetical protein